MATCEADFVRLAGLFGGADRFGPSNRVGVLVDATLGMGGSGAIGENDGFKTGNQTLIRLSASAASFPSNISATQFNEAVRAAFVAELLEIFLSLRGQGQATLNPGYSDGEALSRVFAAWLRPVGYFEVIGRTATQSDPMTPRFPASHWLNWPARGNSVTSPIERDNDPFSIGCGILFLYYLHTQLRRSWSDIVNALGATLAETYVNLSLGATSDAFPEFESLVGDVFPPGTSTSPTAYDLPYEDIFPLLDPSRCFLALESGPLISLSMGRRSLKTP